MSDLFSTSGVVITIKEAGHTTNDLCTSVTYFCVAYFDCITSYFEGPVKAGISSPIDYLNNEPLLAITFGQSNYLSTITTALVGGRMYFTEENALMIDPIRLTIEAWYTGHIITEDEYFYLLEAPLSRHFVSNTTGVYMPTFKHWDPGL